MTREYMMTNVTNRFGLENPVAIGFCIWAEICSDDAVVIDFYRSTMELPICED